MSPHCLCSGGAPFSSLAQTVPSNPIPLPFSSTAMLEAPSHRHCKWLSTSAILDVVLANSVFLLMNVSFEVAYCCRRDCRGTSSTCGSDGDKRWSSSHSSENHVYANGADTDSGGTNATDKSRLLFFHRRNQCELEAVLPKIPVKHIFTYIPAVLELVHSSDAEMAQFEAARRIYSQDVGLWLEQINLGNCRQIFKENGVNGEYLEGLSMFTTEQILRFIRKSHMKWGDFITLCKELRRIKGSSSLSNMKRPQNAKASAQRLA